jgi:hypothetical protein
VGRELTAVGEDEGSVAGRESTTVEGEGRAAGWAGWQAVSSKIKRK